MGDNRQATRAPGPAPAAKKKDAGGDAGGGGAVPDGAAADPGSALTQLGMAHAQTLLGMLQSAGGNAEVAELTSLEAGRQVAAQAKTDKENVDTMTDGQKVEKFGPPGGGGGAGAPPPAEGAPPPGVAEPGAVVGFHGQRATQLAQLAAQHQTVAGQLLAAAAMPGVSPDMIGFLTQGASQNQAQAMSLAQLQQTYLTVSAELGGSEFVGAAMPGADIPVLYQERAAGIQAQVSALDAMNGEYGAALAAEQARIAECNAQIGALQQQIAEAAAAKNEKKEGGAGGAGGGAGGAGPAPAGGSAGGAAGAEAKVQKKETPGGGAAKTSGGGGAGGGAAAKSSGGGGADTGSKTSSAASKGAESAKGASSAKAETSGGGASAPAPTSAGPAAAAPKTSGASGAPAADPVPGLQAQIEQIKVRKAAIEAQIRSNEGLVTTMRVYRELMNSLLSAYQTVLGITPPEGGGGGGGGG